MRLVKYMPPKYVPWTLSEGMLKASAVEEFNDPFEFYWTPKRPEAGDSLDAAHERVRQPYLISEVAKIMGLSFADAAEHLKGVEFQYAKNLSDSFDDRVRQTLGDIPLILQDVRFICFVKDDISVENDLLMWAHYTDSHKGVRLHMDIEEPNQAHLQPITYRSRRIEIDANKLGNLDPETKQGLEYAIFSKSKCWEYEREVRLLLHLAHCEKVVPTEDQQFYAWSFDPDQLVRVDYGIRIPDEIKSDIESAIEDKYPHVERHQADRALEEFSIRYDRI